MKTISKVAQELKAHFLEREEVIDLLLVMVLSQSHGVLFGPPGTGKSSLINALAKHFQKSNFTYQLNRFTKPEEIFGPFLPSSIMQGVFERKLSGKMLDSELVYIDEIYKGSSSILNTMLQALEERTVDNGSGPVKIPLEVCFGASNELPEDGSLKALHDRFLVRYWVHYLKQPDNIRAVFEVGPYTPQVIVSPQELTDLRQHAATVALPPDTADSLLKIKVDLEGESISGSDRRWNRIVRFLKFYAFYLGSNTVQDEHLDILPDLLWERPSDRNRIREAVIKHASPASTKAAVLAEEVSRILADLPSAPDPTDPQAKADWLPKAHTADGQIQGLQQHLEKLKKKSNSPKIDAFVNQVKAMRLDLVSKITKLYNI